MRYNYKRFKLKDGRILSKVYSKGTENQYDRCTEIANKRAINGHYITAYGINKEREFDGESFLVYFPS